MQKTAVGVMLAGFVLAFFSLRAFGIDVLMDAVGFLLVFNGARALSAWDAAFKGASAWAMALVPVAALQLFFDAGAAGVVLGLLRAAGQAGLYWLLAGGLGRLLAAGRQKRLAPLARAAFWLGAAASVATALLPLALPPAAAACGVILTASHIFMLFSLFFACILPDSLLY